MAVRAYRQNIYTFSGFLGLSEQDVFWTMTSELPHIPFQLWGGTRQADRKILRFGSMEELGYEDPYPLICIHIKPLQEKFSDDFTHRDFLGALMKLGIERSTLGDIMVGNKEGYLFCLNSIGDFICDNLNKVRHTNVCCTITGEWTEFVGEEPEPAELQVSSERIDAFIAKVYNKSRKDALELFRSGRVYVNGRLCESSSRLLKEEDSVNVRGFGKFVYLGLQHETRKGKLCIRVRIYR